MHGDSFGVESDGKTGIHRRGGRATNANRRRAAILAASMVVLTTLATACLAGWRSAAAPPLPKLGTTTWHLTRFNHNSAVPAAETGRPWLRFDDKKSRIDGSAGCSHISGPYNRNGLYIHFGKLVATTTACSDTAVTRQDQEFRTDLQNIDRYDILGDTLTLSVGADAVAVLVR